MQPNKLPPELWNQILHFVEEPATGGVVSTRFNESTQKVFKELFEAYQNNSSLAPYADRATQLDSKPGAEHDVNRVKSIFQSITQEAKKFNWKDKKENLLQPALSVQRLEEMAEFIDDAEFVQFTAFIAYNKQEFWNARSMVMKSYSTKEQAAELREWINGQTDPKAIESILDIKTLSSTVFFRGSTMKLELQILPEEIGLFTSLDNLNLSNTAITKLPPEIGRLTSLTGLNIQGTAITELPPEIGQLKSLLVLYLSGTSITSLPPEFAELASLRLLEISNTSLTIDSLPPNMIERYHAGELMVR